MLARRAALVALLGLSLGLGGCGAGFLIDHLDDIAGGDDEHNYNVATELNGDWRVRSFSGSGAGAHTIPAASDFTWSFDSDGSVTVTSVGAVPAGSGNEVYNLAGEWFVIYAPARQIRLVITHRNGVRLSGDERISSNSSYRPEGRQLILTTGVLGHGDVRYVMDRRPTDSL